MQRVVGLAILLSVLAWGQVVQAELIDRGNGLIYDDVLDITWLQDASLGGNRTWAEAVNWADTLVFGTFDDWRLPSMDVNGDTNVVNCNGASEMDCRDNELGYMFYQNSGGTFPQDLSGNQGLIQNVQVSHWSGTDIAGSGFAWVFDFLSGGQVAGHGLSVIAAWAVRDGDVGAAPLVDVTIDIIPGKEPNRVRLFGRAVPVAILTTDTFDATTVDPASVTLAGASVYMKGDGQTAGSHQDVDGDGDVDLVVYVSAQQLTLTPDDTEAVLTGTTFDGTMIQGTDTVRVVP